MSSSLDKKKMRKKKSIVQKLKSYIKDTTDYINKLESIDPLTKGAFLVTMDINALAKFLEVDCSTSISTRVILKFLSKILNLNNFIFNDENILQINIII